MVIIGLGAAVLLRNWTRVDLKRSTIFVRCRTTTWVSSKQAPRSGLGAISYRMDEVMLWCVLRYRSFEPFLFLILSRVVHLEHSIPPRVRMQGRFCIHGTSLHRILRRPPE